MASDVFANVTYTRISLGHMSRPFEDVSKQEGAKVAQPLTLFLLQNSHIDRRLQLDLVSVRADARRISHLPSAHTSAHRTLHPELWMFAAKHVENVSVWGVCTLRGMYTA